jgi:hypothetical protein
MKIIGSKQLLDVLKTHKGSVKMQKCLDNLSPNDISYIIENIKDRFSELMINQYGNYFC